MGLLFRPLARARRPAHESQGCKARVRGEKDGLTRSEAERALRRLIEVESLRPPLPIEERPRTVDDVADDLRERLAIEGARLSRGLSPKTVRTVMTFLHAVSGLALANEWTERNPVAGAAARKRRRQGDANPDLQFLTIEQLDRVLAEIPDVPVAIASAPTRRGRAGPAPPPPPDVLGPVSPSVSPPKRPPAAH